MLPYLRRPVTAVAAMVLALASSASAHADVLPPNECANSQSVGSSCTTAGANYNQDGICTQTTCAHASPGVAPSACILCLLPDAGPMSDAAADATVDAATSDASSGPVVDSEAVAVDSGPVPADSGPVLADSGPGVSDSGLGSDSTVQNDAGPPSGGPSQALNSSGNCAVSMFGSGMGGAATALTIGAIVGIALAARRRRPS